MKINNFSPIYTNMLNNLASINNKINDLDNEYMSAYSSFAASQINKNNKSNQTNLSDNNIISQAVDLIEKSGFSYEKTANSAMNNQSSYTSLLSAMKEVNATMELIVTIRNNAIKAYQEVLRLVI